MQNELFSEASSDVQGVQSRSLGIGIPQNKESPVARAMRRIRTIMLKKLAPVLAYSGGKDSSILVALVLTTAREMKGVISVFRESSTKFPRPGLTSGSAAVRRIPKVFECGAGLYRLDEPSRPPPLAGPGVAGSVAVRY